MHRFLTFFLLLGMCKTTFAQLVFTEPLSYPSNTAGWDLTGTA
ncbi:hypothetical protein OAM07_00505 [Crocinitomicaceae bacterium]|nr:hypothetical protein [Crocinitomicaceae bacterium]MDC3308848.1 hypothetical protein [Crocinitomicaceae bacterium]